MERRSDPASTPPRPAQGSDTNASSAPDSNTPIREPFEHQVGRLDAFDFYMLLMECRIVQAR